MTTDKLLTKSFPGYSEAQVRTLYTHATAVFSAVSTVPGLVFEEPVSCGVKDITYRFIDNLPTSLSDEIKSRTCGVEKMRRVGNALATIHARPITGRVGALLHGDYVPHNIFCNDGTLAIIDAHPPVNLPYRENVLYGDKRRDIITLVFGIFSNVGFEAVRDNHPYYKGLVAGFLDGYAEKVQLPQSFLVVLLDYLYDIYVMRRRSFGALRAILHLGWCGTLTMIMMRAYPCKRAT